MAQKATPHPLEPKVPDTLLLRFRVFVGAVNQLLADGEECDTCWNSLAEEGRSEFTELIERRFNDVLREGDALFEAILASGLPSPSGQRALLKEMLDLVNARTTETLPRHANPARYLNPAPLRLFGALFAIQYDLARNGVTGVENPSILKMLHENRM